MKRIAVILIISVVTVIGLSTLANAFTTSEKIIVANSLVAIARVSAGGFSADQRIDRVNDRLAYILGYEPLTPGSIRAVKMGGDYAIMVGNRLLVTVTAADARANHTTVAGLASMWLRYAREAIPQARPHANMPR